jgi:hypothetical protein
MELKCIRHGEILLQPVSKLPRGKKTEVDLYIVGHSETGHHHVLESKAPFEVMDRGEKHALYLRLFEPGKLVHKKTVDKHKTLPVAPGTYRVIYKNEYDPFEKVIRRVQD